MITDDAFNHILDSMPEAKASLRAGRGGVDPVLCSGIERTRQDSEYGQMTATGVNVRYLSAADLEKGTDLGDVVGIKMDFETSYRDFRISSKAVIGGVVRLTLEAEFA